ncbi:NAD(P)-dependent oxidoreductase [Deinococcus hopiensis]|uniref:3-hydroxyisobutyrate dehydrogenase n=1 Tax=Deinococcus hopiensis KR-140 TaxID=695939 RepID=A0A1W1UNJ3_9DEIO|nr:NAD(P)-dependent oxidoreductase [Deinococcus hopiensis]SMB82657.1 3-hydroxyisobutyrate dehydrogenase [Deinococcus hopiensis KR-140]
MTDTSVSATGFLGLGVMGQPMALNLVRAGTPLVVWNRSPERCMPLQAAGAEVAATPTEVFSRTHSVILMLVDEAATDAVLGRGTSDFPQLVAGRTLIVTSSTTPEYSRALAADIQAHGGKYVEAPVSGSRVPAEQGALVGMLAGDQTVVEAVRPLLRPVCCETVYCGPVGHALQMKFAVNLYLNVMLAGLAEAAHFAQRQGLDLRQFQAVLNAGPMASSVSRVKVAKLAARDFSVQAAMSDAFKSASMISAAASNSGTAAPLIALTRALLGETVALGASREDMIAVVRALEARTAAGQDAALVGDVRQRGPLEVEE